MMKTLITGGSGFVGKRLCTALLGQGHDVRCLSRGVIPVHEDVEWIQGDFSDAELVSSAVRGVDVIYHLISTTLPSSSNRDVKFDLVSNVLPTLHMLQSARLNGVKRVIYTSSGGAVYGAPKRCPIREEDSTDPICAYGVHKLTVEKYLGLFYHAWGLDYRILRISNAYGTGHTVGKNYGAVSQFIHNATNHRPIEIWGDGTTVRDYVHVDDVVKALVLALRHAGPSRTLNIGTGKGHTLLDLVSIIEEVLGEKVEVSFSEARTVDVANNVLDITKAVDELGWCPTRNLEENIQEMVRGSHEERSRSVVLPRI